MTVKGGTSQACAACKYQRRKCISNCPLAPYFPANQTKMFQNAHRLFGVHNIMRILNLMTTQEQKDEAMKSIIFESDMREMFPVTGCLGIIKSYHLQYMQAMEELHYVHAQLAMWREETQQMVDHNYSPSSELQLGVTNPARNNALLVPQHPQIANNSIPLEANHQFVMNSSTITRVDNYSFCVESSEDVTKPLWIQHLNFNNNNGIESVAIQSQLENSQTFPIQQETEVDYDEIPFDTMADDRQSYIESKDACESSCCESPWKDAATHATELISKNELKNAAACFSLTSAK
ncbi:LOB domain-containing protein 27-like [Diospyros lotus]|uniref:LOB domain-containing protein 27-like n=1 Tax=Diospyros lotus TaxID=55363 RepID=UPI002253F25A|nr:LOB domain-containing protein 27-like [Diospyros lotus]